MTKKKGASPPKEKLAQSHDDEPAQANRGSLDTGRIEQLRFDQLAVSPLNVRKDAEVSADDELVHSIRAHGLLQPLIGYAASSGPAMVLVCAGQRRLLALGHIVGGETMIPVRIVDEQTAIEVSLAENLERKNMNPADELAAFKALIDTGHYDSNRIADRFGFDRRYVRRRLKMAVLHPDILDALRGGTIGVSSAEAYAASDDHDLQLQVFKEQSRPNTWQAHAPSAIVRAYNAAGIRADTTVGKFIGGVAAYEAAGGSVARDEAFAALFESEGATAPKLTDPAIVQRLYEHAQAEHQAAVEAKARDQLPFVTAVDWCDARGNSPKLPKNSPLVLLTTGYGSLGYVDEDDVKSIAEKVSEAGGAVHALAFVTYEGEPAIRPDALLVGKAALEAARPKKEESGGAAPQSMTDEDRAALDRERKVREQMEKMYGRSLIGETPGFGVQRVNYDRYHGHLVLDMVRLEPKGDDIDFTDQWHPRVKAELLEPFREAAEAKVAKLAALAERAKAEAAKASEDVGAKLDDLAAKSAADWPAVVTVEVDGSTLLIRRMDGDDPVLRLEDEMDDPWENYDPTMVVEVIRDQIGEDSTVSIATFATTADFEAEDGDELQPAEVDA